jgi:hypothetical protein
MQLVEFSSIIDYSAIHARLVVIPAESYLSVA